MTPASQDYGGASLDAINRTIADARSVFEGAGFAAVDPGSVLEAENLLDLYGEDIRARAFVFDGGMGKDLCLRPDLTLAICRHHLGGGGGDAKYVASGPVYRRPSAGETRPAQFLQVGCEWFGASDPASADAETFRLVRDALVAAGVKDISSETGDLGVLFALIDAANIPERWRARLKRHVWRPSRFTALLEDYASPDADDPGRHALLKAIGALQPGQARAAIERMLALSETTHVGLRSPDEIASRFLEQAEDAQAHPLAREVVEAIDTAATLVAPSGEALTRLRDLSSAAGINIAPALDRFESRLARVQDLGIDAAALPFNGDYGRNLEYYDGFVFEFFDAKLADTKGRRAAQLAGGGRYDGLLGAASRAFGLDPANGTAIGAAIRPETLLSVREGLA
jgi:ATP phosphoribosyltransferase regulatory subunit